ncbi:MAG: hypothetical protein ACI8W8_001186 [Rhodothermales bacterium]
MQFGVKSARQEIAESVQHQARLVITEFDFSTVFTPQNQTQLDEHMVLKKGGQIDSREMITFNGLPAYEIVLGKDEQGHARYRCVSANGKTFLLQLFMLGGAHPYQANSEWREAAFSQFAFLIESEKSGDAPPFLGIRFWGGICLAIALPLYANRRRRRKC